MALRKKIRQIGNSIALPIPNEIFAFLGFDPRKVKYKLTQDNTGSIFIIILEPDVMALDEKKFQKLGATPAVIIPKPLCHMWKIGLAEGQNKEIEISFTDSAHKWQIKPVW